MFRVKDFVDKLIVNDGYSFHCTITNGSKVFYCDYAGDAKKFENIPVDILKKDIESIEMEQSFDDHQTFIVLNVK